MDEISSGEKVLQQMDSLELMVDDTNPNSGIVNDFIEDYSVIDDTLIDKEIVSEGALRNHPIVDELFVLNNEYEKTRQPEDIAEKLLERLELEALIKRAEDKLLPEENIETADETQQKKLNPTESSEDEGFQLRLSCILEESESDASGSGLKIAQKNALIQPAEPSKPPETLAEEPVQDQSALLELDVTESADVKPDTCEKAPYLKRGRSAEPRHCHSDSDTVSISSEKIIKPPKWIISRRGKSLDSSLAERKKGPPVPPETYLWEELRRGRAKGGYPWTHIDKPPFDEKTWKNQADHEYEPINPPPLEQQPSVESTDAKEDAHILGLLRIPNDDQLVISAEDMEVEAIEAAREFQSDIEDRFLPTSMTTTTASRTDCDVNTSMLDSSGLEDLPLKRDSRSKKAMQLKTEQMRLQAQGLQQRIRTQAGKLRNKLRNLPRPSFQRKQEKKPDNEEKSRFRLPERPKFTLPERPRFKMPQKPKIALPNFSKPLRERQVKDEPRKNIFDMDFKTYPRMFNKKSKERGDYATSSPKQTRSATPPPRPVQPARKKGPVGQRWVNRFDDIRFVDDRASNPSHRSDRSESLSDFHDKDFGIGDDELENVRLPPARTLSTKSSISHLSSRSSEDPHRKGVLEEIDSDQFFLRQKGISQENIDMGKYLSEEIREAFRAPVANALQQLDLDYEADSSNQIEDLKVKRIAQSEPQAPTRSRSLKRMKQVGSQEQDENKIESKAKDENFEDNVSEYYKTPPPPEEYLHYKVPRRTSKRKHSSDENNKQKPSREWVQVDIETSLEPTVEDEVEAKKANEEHEYIIPEGQQPDVPKRTRSLSRGARSTRSVTHDRDRKIEEPKTPVAPKRSSSKSLHSLNMKNDRFVRRDPDCYSVQSLKLTESSGRGAKGSYSSFSEESKTLPKARSRRFQSLATGVNSWAPQAPQRTRSQSSVSSKTRNQYQVVSEDGYAGYAVVEKVKPARPPPPRRRKTSPSPDFNTFPRSQPSRPVRNYATLGPSRPPRRSKQDRNQSQSLEHIYTEDMPDIHGSNKDLQATDVVEKMKGRPLPAPPRPPRLKSKSEEMSVEMIEEICVSTQTDPLPDDLCLEDDIIQEFSHEQMKIQQEFLKEMREEEERIHRQMEAKRTRLIELEQTRRVEMDQRQSPEAEEDVEGEEPKKAAQQLVDDLGYASLDRRQTNRDDDVDDDNDVVDVDPGPSTSRSFQRPPSEIIETTTNTPQQPVYVPMIPSVLTSETLRVGNLEVEHLRVNRLETNSLTVGELNTQQIQVQNIRGTNLGLQEINSHSGQLSLENIEIPPEVIQQIIARIPWEQIVQHPPTQSEETVQSLLPTPTTSRRRFRPQKHLNRSQASSDEDSAIKRQTSPRRSHRAVAVIEERPSIAHLGRQLVIACTDAGLGAARRLINDVSNIPADRARYLQAMFCFVIVAIAGYILLILHARDVHHHHWDFQFPPQPPRQ